MDDKWICRTCGHKYSFIPTSCIYDGGEIRPINEFDNLSKNDLSEKLSDLLERVEELEAGVVAAEENRLRREAGIQW